MSKIVKVEIQGICDESTDSYTMNLVTYLDDTEEPLVDYLEFVDRETLESGIAETIEYMNARNYEYEKYFFKF